MNFQLNRLGNPLAVEPNNVFGNGFAALFNDAKDPVSYHVLMYQLISYINSDSTVMSLQVYSPVNNLLYLYSTSNYSTSFVIILLVIIRDHCWLAVRLFYSYFFSMILCHE